MSEFKRTVLRSIDEDIIADKDEINWACIDLIEDLQMVSIENRRFVFYTKDGNKYYDFLRLGEFESLNLGLISFDSSNVVNIREIRYFDEKWNNLYFVKNPEKDSLRASITRIMSSIFKSNIHEIISHNREKDNSEHVPDDFLEHIKIKIQQIRKKIRTKSEKIVVDRQ